MATADARRKEAASKKRPRNQIDEEVRVKSGIGASRSRGSRAKNFFVVDISGAVASSNG
jgi:hypothetical protein